MLGDKPINLGETWSSGTGDNEGVVIGFKTNGTILIEITKSTGFYNVGDIQKLFNITWTKVEPKRKIYVYYSAYSKRFYCTESPEKPNPDIYLMETREYEIKDLT